MAIHVPRGRVRDDPFQSVPLPSFGGLNLQADPQEVGWGGAVDVLNVALDRSGRIRSRDGYGGLNGTAAATPMKIVAPFERVTADDHILGSGIAFVAAISTVGAIAGSTTIGINNFVRIGTATGEFIYGAAPLAGLTSWNGSAFATTATMKTVWVGLSPTDNRLVAASKADAPTNSSRVFFSNAGTPTTFGANDFVDLHPGDGEQIMGVAHWQNFLFVFKQSKFFVFYGNSTDSTGATEFNYRPVVGVGIPAGKDGAVVAGEDGVYFYGPGGIYRTTGGPAQAISGPIEPFLRGWSIPLFAGGTLSSDTPYLGFAGRKLYVSVEAGALVRRTFVYDPSNGTWTFYDLPAYGICSLPGSDTVYFADNSTQLKQHSSAYTTDSGAAITSRYRTGFGDLGPPEGEKILRELLIDGYGTVGVQVAGNDGALDTATNVTLGTSPAIAQSRHRRAYRARNFSLQLGGTGAWSVSRVVANVLGGLPPGGRTT